MIRIRLKNGLKSTAEIGLFYKNISGKRIFIETGDQGLIEFRRKQDSFESYTGHHAMAGTLSHKDYVLGDGFEFSIISGVLHREKYQFDGKTKPVRIA